MLELKNLCFGVETEDSTKEIIKDVSFRFLPKEEFHAKIWETLVAE